MAALEQGGVAVLDLEDGVDLFRGLAVSLTDRHLVGGPVPFVSEAGTSSSSGTGMASRIRVVTERYAMGERSASAGKT